MGRKGKEPAGLRRWRLAHKKHKRAKRAYKVYKSDMRTARSVARRRGRSRKGRKGSRAIPILSLMPIMPAVGRILDHSYGKMSDLPAVVMFETTGYDPQTGTLQTAVAYRQVGLVIAAVVGHKLANRFGVNKTIKRFTGGLLQL